MEAVLQNVAEGSRRGRIRFNRARNLDRARTFSSARHMHRHRNKKHRRHHKRHRTDRCRRFVSLAAIHRAIAHPRHFAAHFARHVVAAVFVAGLMSGSGFRARRNLAFVMVLGNIAEASRAARHRRSRKRSGCHRCIQKRDREQTSQRAKHPLSITVSVLQVQSKNSQSIKPAL